MLCEDKLINLDEYEQISKIGQGKFGTVYLFQNKITSALYAGKEIEIGDDIDDSKSLNRYNKREIKIML